MAAKKKITEFKRKVDLYVCRYAEKPSTIRIEDYDVPLPVMPKRSEMENFHLPRRQQRFMRTVIPKDLQFWDKRDERAFVEAEFHKRKHGVWYLINNKPVYLTGKAYMFFNFWHTEAGGLPQFRMEAVEFFLVWEMVERDPNCYGLAVFKPRRIGETEKSLFLLAEYATRVRKAQCGMQSIKEADAHKNYKRLVNSVNKLPYFFQPVRKGTDDPEKKLEFRYPANLITTKQLREKSGETEYVLMDQDTTKKPLESVVNYETTKLKRYDSNRLERYYLDEFGKMTEMDPIAQWGVLRPTMHLYSGKIIVGKAIFTSTIEDFKNGETMANAKKIWDMANYKERDENGRTMNGLYRIFRSALLTGEVDRFGFHKKQEMREFIMNERESLLRKGFLDDYADLCRRQPLVIDDVFTLPSSECALLPGLLDQRKRQIENGVNPDGSPYKCPVVKGDLKWKNNVFGGDVEWIAHPNGRWEISQHPVRPNHRDRYEIYDIPGNRRLYTNGIDPVDHTSNQGSGSDFGNTVFRRLDKTVDCDLRYDEFGNVVPEDVWKMKTDQFVCTYKFRPEDPFEGYEDALKTAIYYGVPMLIENQKPGLINWTENLFGGRFRAYIANRPVSTKITSNKYTASTESGVPASTRTINMYVDALKWHVKNRIDTYHHLTQIADYRQFKVSNRTERDLTVASGWALTNDMDNIRELQEQRAEAWSEPLWKKHKKRA